MNGHSTHVSVGLIEWDKEHRIIMYILPAHTTTLSHQSKHWNMVPKKPYIPTFTLIPSSFFSDHCVKLYRWRCITFQNAPRILQPLDVGCYGPLHRVYNNECHKPMRLTSSVITRYIGEISSLAYTKASSSENLQTDFQKTGIYPLNAADIDPLTLATSEKFEPVDVHVPESITNSGDAPQSETEAPFFLQSWSVIGPGQDRERGHKIPRRCLGKLSVWLPHYRKYRRNIR